MRKEQDATSSFDLFLDTICNTFGGIVFLAILLAVMVQNRSLIQTSDSPKSTHASPAEVRKAMAQLAELSTEQQLMQMSLAAIPEEATAVDDAEFLQLQERQRQLKHEIEENLAREIEVSKELAQHLEANAIQRAQNQTVPNELHAARELLATTRADFERILNAKQQTLRVPRVRSSSQASILVLVQDGALYLAKTPSSFGRDFNDAQVSTAQAFGNRIEITPIRGTGWSLVDGSGRDEFQRLVGQARLDGNSITIAVWPESFAQFSQLREIMIQAGVFYQLWPQLSDESLKVSFGGGSSSVQ